MHPGDESGRPDELRVTDRRRFTETGDARDAPDAPTARVDAVIAPQSEREAAGHDAHAHGSPEPGAAELGIDAVFFIFYQSALIALGAPEVAGEGREPDLGDARQAIDFLRILEAKTAGNLSATETDTLRQLLDDAQLRYVQAARGAGG